MQNTKQNEKHTTKNDFNSAPRDLIVSSVTSCMSMAVFDLPRAFRSQNVRFHEGHCDHDNNIPDAHYENLGHEEASHRAHRSSTINKVMVVVEVEVPMVLLPMVGTTLNTPVMDMMVIMVCLVVEMVALQIIWIKHIWKAPLHLG